MSVHIRARICLLHEQTARTANQGKGSSSSGPEELEGEMRERSFPMQLGIQSGPDSAVGIATGYGLDGPGIESRWGRDFLHLSRTALGLIQPPVQ